MVTSSNGPGKAAHLLGEDDRLGRYLQAGFGGVVGIIEADGDEFLRIGDAGADARLAAHQRQGFGLGLLDAGEALGRDGFAADIVDQAG